MKRAERSPKKPKLRIGEDGGDTNSLHDYIFNVLWRKTRDYDKTMYINIPDTVVFLGDLPVAWYFSSDGAIKKKLRNMLTIQEILSGFSKPNPSSQVLATFMQAVDDGDNHRILFEHLDKAGLEKFLRRQGGIPNGILQRFIDPKGDRNFTITAKWSPTSNFMERVDSRHRIDDLRYDIYQRAPTIDGTVMNTRRKGIRGTEISNHIDRLCFNIAQHIRSVAEDKIEVTRLTLHFKIDQHDNLMLLFCSTLNYHDITTLITKPRDAYKVDKEPVMMNSDRIVDKDMMILDKPRSLKKNHFCISCEKTINKDKAYEMDLRTIARHHYCNRLLNEQRPESTLQAGESSGFGRSSKADAFNQTSRIQENVLNGSDDETGQRKAEENNYAMRRIGNIVPPEIYNAFPNINKLAFRKLRQDSKFMTKVVPVCEDCYLFLISLNDASGSERLTKFHILKDDTRLKGTGRLRPDNLKIRYIDTLQRVEENEIAKFNRERLLTKIADGEERAQRILLVKNQLSGQGSLSKKWEFAANSLNYIRHTRASEPIVSVKPKMTKMERLGQTSAEFRTTKSFLKKEERSSGAPLVHGGIDKYSIDHILARPKVNEELSTERTYNSAHPKQTSGFLFSSRKHMVSSSQLIGYTESSSNPTRDGVDAEKSHPPLSIKTHKSKQLKEFNSQGEDRFSMYSYFNYNS